MASIWETTISFVPCFLEATHHPICLHYHRLLPMEHPGNGKVGGMPEEILQSPHIWRLLQPSAVRRKGGSQCWSNWFQYTGDCTGPVHSDATSIVVPGMHSVVWDRWSHQDSLPYSTVHCVCEWCVVCVVCVEVWLPVWCELNVWRDHGLCGLRGSSNHERNTVNKHKDIHTAPFTQSYGQHL